MFLHTGQLTQCAPTPILEIPTWEDKKGDVKTIRAIDTPSPTSVLPGLPGRTWYLQPYGPGQNTQHAETRDTSYYLFHSTKQTESPHMERLRHVLVVILTDTRPSPQTGS